VKRCRIEVGIVRPDQCSNLGVESDLTALKVAGFWSGPNSGPRNTGRKSMRCSVPSAKATTSVYGPTILNCVTR
jgi:hypothetical protein